MSEYIEFTTEVDIQQRINEFVNRINRYIDEATLAKVERQLEEYGYVKVTRCRDCKWFTPEHFYEEEREYGVKEILSDPPDCGNPKRCHTTYDSLTGKMVPVHIVTEPDGYCAWADRRESCQKA